MKPSGSPARLFLLALLAAALLAPGASFAQDPPDPDTVAALLEGAAGEDFVLGEVVVKLKTPRGAELDAQALDTERIQMGLDPEVETTSGGELIFKIGTSRASVMAADDLRAETLASVEAMAANPDVEYAEPNYILRIVATPDDPRFPDQWHYRTHGGGAGASPGGIGLTEAWDVTTGSSSVVVAVIDTGILPNHPDIVGSPNLLPGFDFITRLNMANDGDGRDADPTDPGDAIATNECGFGSPPSPRPNSWHGTHVAGTVGVGRTNNAAGVAGVNHQVGAVSVRVLGKCGGITTDIADGIRWAAGLPVPGVPANPNPAKVINMSLGGRGSCATSRVQQNAINDAVAAGVTVVVAAGNDAMDASGFRPASCAGVITVAASETRGRLASRYSNFGTTVEILAPGGDVRRDDDGDGNPDGVLSMVDPSSGTYAFYNGTSMAAPHVAGVAALMLADDPTLTPAQILSRMQATARPRSSTECPKACGAGLLNAAGAVAGLPLLTLQPLRFEVQVGDSATLTASSLPGVTVSFSSADPAVAAVTPPNAITDATGKATATVTGVAAGSTTIGAAAGGATAQASVTVKPKPTPALSLWGLALLAAAAIWLLSRHERQSARAA